MQAVKYDEIQAKIESMEQAIAKTKSPYLKRDYEKAIKRLKRKLKGELNVGKNDA